MKLQKAPPININPRHVTYIRYLSLKNENEFLMDSIEKLKVQNKSLKREIENLKGINKNENNN